jgi:uncharacterized protein YdaU (DUF1376 family)
MSIPYMPLYVQDYEADTAHLSPEEDGIYMRLLRLCWRTPGCSIPADEAWIARMLRVSPEYAAERVVPIIAEFFKQEKGRLFSPRLQREYERVRETSMKRSVAGKKGGRPAKPLKNNETIKSPAKANEKQNESIQNHNHISPLTPQRGGESGDFEAFWKAYPERDGGNPRKPAEAKYARAIAKGATHDEIMAGLAGYVAEQKRLGKIGTTYVQQAQFWLSQERWRDYRPPAQARATGITLSDDFWRAELREWEKRGRVGWYVREVTPPPDDPGCRIPAHVLAEFGIERRAA